MAEIILSLLNDDDMYNEFCKIFFKEYDKNCDNLISRDELKAPLEEVIKHFPIDRMGQYKLMSVYKTLDKANEKTKQIIEQLDSNVTDDIIDKIINILNNNNNNNNNNITFDDFKNIVRLLLYCLIDHAAKHSSESDTEDNDENLFSLNNEEVNYDGFINILIDDILNNYTNLENLKYSIIKVLNNISINNINIDVSIEDINVLFKYNDIKNKNKNQIIELLKNFIKDLW